MPSEKVTVLQRSWIPQKHWESKGLRHRKGGFSGQNQELFFASPKIQENKEKGELNPSAQKCTAKQFSTGSTSDLLSGRGEGFQGCRLMLAAGLPWACLFPAGMEVAAFLSDKAGTISVVEREEFPFQHAMGPQVGGVAMKVSRTWG